LCLREVTSGSVPKCGSSQIGKQERLHETSLQANFRSAGTCASHGDWLRPMLAKVICVQGGGELNLLPARSGPRTTDWVRPTVCESSNIPHPARSLLPHLPWSRIRKSGYVPVDDCSLVRTVLNACSSPELQKKLIPGGAPAKIKTANEVAPMILALVDKATHDTDVFTQRDGTILPW
jgi:hypothetical protein